MAIHRSRGLIQPCPCEGSGIISVYRGLSARPEVFLLSESCDSSHLILFPSSTGERGDLAPDIGFRRSPLTWLSFPSCGGGVRPRSVVFRSHRADWGFRVRRLPCGLGGSLGRVLFAYRHPWFFRFTGEGRIPSGGYPLLRSYGPGGLSHGAGGFFSRARGGSFLPTRVGGGVRRARIADVPLSRLSAAPLLTR